jgi:hypothetical protein
MEVHPGVEGLIVVLQVQPWISHGLHNTWASRRGDSFIIDGQPTLADVGDSSIIHGSADVGWDRRTNSEMALEVIWSLELLKVHYLKCQWSMVWPQRYHLSEHRKCRAPTDHRYDCGQSGVFIVIRLPTWLLLEVLSSSDSHSSGRKIQFL